MIPILVKSDDIRSGRPRLVRAGTGVKTQKQMQQYNFLFKKVAAIAWIHQILNLFDHEQYIYLFFLSHDLIALLNGLFQKFD